jgi:hypothetical protein
MEEDLSVTLDNHRTLWLTEISKATFDDQAVDGLESDGGLFVVLEDTQEQRLHVLAKAASLFNGAALLDLFAQQMRRPTLKVVR